MDKEKPTETLLRPNLRVKPSQWSAAQRGSLASRSAIIATVIAILGGMGLVFVYPYFNIDRFRKIQKINRAEINPEHVQPTGLPIWRDPFDRKKAG